MDPLDDSSQRHAIRLGPRQLKAFACCHPRGTHKDYADAPPGCFFKAKATIHFIHIAPEPKAFRVDPYCSQPQGLCRMNAGFKDLAKATGMRKQLRGRIWGFRKNRDPSCGGSYILESQLSAPFFLESPFGVFSNSKAFLQTVESEPDALGYKHRTLVL